MPIKEFAMMEFLEFRSGSKEFLVGVEAWNWLDYGMDRTDVPV